MPSSPSYVRDYKQERRTMLSRGENTRHTERLRDRRVAQKKGLVRPHDGKDIDHIKPLSKGGNPSASSNQRVVSAHDNRSFPRNPDGSMIANHPKTKE